MRGNYRRLVLAAGAGLLAALPLGAAGEKIDYEAINKIKAQGMQPQNSKVMEISSWLTDVHGPRLSGSPNIQKAGEWAVTQMKAWGLQNVALETWTEPELRARLDQRQVLHGRRVAAVVSDSRDAGGVDAGHRRPRAR